MSRSGKMVLSEKQVRDLRARGITFDEGERNDREPNTKGKRRKPAKEQMVEASVTFGRGVVVMVLPIFTASEANISFKSREKWDQANRKKGARDIVFRHMAQHMRKFAAFAEHYRKGGVLELTFTRLGCKWLDVMANLGMSMKAVEDAVAMYLGANDGNRRAWLAKAAQDDTFPRMGVKVEIRIL